MINLILSFLLISNYSNALEASAQGVGTTVSLSIKGIEIPREQFRKHFKSGLHSRLQIEIAAVENNKTLFKANQNWKIFYDLWDEVYRISILDAIGNEKKIEYTNIDDLFKALENLQFENIKSTSQFQNLPKDKGELGIRITLNPVSQETVDRMKKWINQRRVPGLPLGTNGPFSNHEYNTSTPQLGGLFNEILGHQMNDAKQGATWSFEGTTKLKIKDKDL